MGSSRFYVAVLAAVIVTAGLFLVMSVLIEPRETERPPVYSGDPIKVTRDPVDETPRTQDPVDDDEPPVQPPEPNLPKPDPTDPPEPGGEGPGVPGPDPIDLPDDFTGTLPDTLPQPIVRIAPDYPRRPQERCQEGYVVVEFTVTVDGTTRDIRVLDSSDSAFEREAVRAVQRWKYRPAMKDGEPVAVRLRVRVDFELTGQC